MFSVEKIAQKNHAPAFVIAFVSALHGHLEENRIPVKDGLLLLKTVSMTVINGVNLSLLRCKETAEAPAPVAKYPRYEHYGFATQQATLPAVLIQRQVITPEDMIGFASALLRPELREDGNDLLAALASKLQEQCQELPVDELNSIWVPFLRSFSHLVLESGVVHDISPYRELYVTLLNSWLVRYVRHESKEGESLVRETLKCHCGDCLQLNIFLASAERQQGQFSMNKDRRQHLHQMLDKERIDCTHETSRVGNPQTLVVTKTFKFKSNKIVRQEWKRRYEMAVKHLGAFQQDHLAALLGPEQYSHITKMTHLRASQSRSQRRRSGQLELHPESANPSVLAPSIALHHRQGHPTVPPPVTGVKRRHAPSEEDVIDLT